MSGKHLFSQGMMGVCTVQLGLAMAPSGVYVDYFRQANNYTVCLINEEKKSEKRQRFALNLLQILQHVMSLTHLIKIEYFI